MVSNAAPPVVREVTCPKCGNYYGGHATGAADICDCRTTEAIQRQKFESWISSPPYERELSRWPQDETKFGWPGQYGDIAVQLAWEAWCEGRKA